MKLPRVLNNTPDWTQFSNAELEISLKAATKLVSSLQALSEKNQQIVQTLIADDVFVEWNHYPENDVRDEKNASQYFYHAHPGLQRPFVEHGHFHLFVHAEKMGLRKPDPRYSSAPAHLIAVSMDAQGIPSGFFVVNRWVTKGAWLTKAQCEQGLQHFKIQASKGKKEINTFLQALVQLYRHHISALLEQRDVIMKKLSEKRDRRTVFADPQIEVLCYVPIQIMDDIAALEAAM
ncbi:hypothetical protein H8K32_14280 [Undibacterium jejuense]|uniref:DUF6969 domain-containing protein n=1 Tax=Undibacterium jejuense TaxID=1344949 RepID=A0A923HPE1_9BURK|nr:hypothetical protein [Undibacterium jejuense]MBC3863271.1 hypothetical protein [Undibacterium jejuense]